MIQVYFTLSSIHFTDTLYVYDGSNTSAPLIGAYNNFTNPTLALLAIDASLSNASGCLTVRFVSDATDQLAGFNGLVSCEHKCQEVTATLDLSLTSPSPDTNYIAICPGTEIDFSANALFPENNYIYNQSESTTTFEWVFGDGNSATGENVSHTYADIGGYTVSLFATDIEGCVSSNSIDTRVVIAGSPFSNTNPPPSICANDTLQMDFDMVGIGGTIVEGTPFSEEITTTLGVTDMLTLPDGTGVCYESSVIFNCFDPGQTLDNPQDFLNLSASLEHSFIGDLEISLICPNGQTLVLKSFIDELGGTGYGGGASLGEPNQADDQVPGVGWDYSWTPINPVYGSMGQEAEGGMSPLVSDSYEPFATFYDLVGCPLNGQWTIEICDNWGADDGTIFGWEMTLNPDIAPDTWDYTVGIDQYAWTTGPYIIGQNDESITVSPTIGGFFDYNYNIIDHYGCSWNTNVTLEVVDNPTVDLGPDITFCPGINSHFFNANNPGSTFTWQDFSTNSTYNAVLPGDYAVTVTNGQCKATDEVKIYPHTGFTLQNSVSNVQCFGGNDGSLSILATTDYPPYLYTWSDEQIGEDAEDLTVGEYFVTIIDNMGCTTHDTMTVTQPSILEASSNSTIVSCFGGNNGEIDLSVVGGVPNYTFQWNNGDVNEDIFDLSAGDYSVSIYDDQNCILVHEVTVSQATEISTALAGDHTYCNEIEEVLSPSATGGTAPYSYLWSTGETTESILISPSTNTNYRVTITDSENCTNTENVTVSVYPEMELILSSKETSVCPGESTLLNIEVQGGSGQPYLTFLNGSLTTFPIEVFPTDEQLYTVEVRDNCFHNIIDDITLHNYPSVPEITFTSNISQGCPPLEIQFNNESSNDNSTFLWEFSNGSNVVNTVTGKNPTLRFYVPGVYNAHLKIENEYGCSGTAENFEMIYIFPTPVAEISAHPTQTSIINPNISFKNATQGGAAYLWNFGDGGESDTKSPLHKYNSIGDFEATLIAYSINGCINTTRVLVHISEEFTFFAPEAFSPDFDGINEEFKVFGNGIDNSNFQLYVYDRWGQPVFSSNDLNKGWNGKINNTNNAVKIGSYSWVCIYKDTNGLEHEKSGVINLLR